MKSTNLEKVDRVDEHRLQIPDGTYRKRQQYRKKCTGLNKRKWQLCEDTKVTAEHEGVPYKISTKMNNDW